MRVFFTRQKLPEETTCTLFLMGPTPRADAVSSWRTDALRILDRAGFGGDVFVPEPADGVWPADYAEQVAWEDAALNRADRIVVWLPRDLATLPGLTTNDEWGFWKNRDPARLILGTPVEAQKVRYQQHYAKELDIPVYATLEETCRAAAAERGVLRRGGECEVPLHIWRTASFQAWHGAQKKAGNRLCGARVEWVFRIKPTLIFYWALRVDIEVTAEGRHKANEVILARPDVAAVVLYRPGSDILDTEVVLVREFRAASRTPDGYIWELPSGSSFKDGQAMEITAVEEVREETGVTIAPQQLRRHAARQVAGTLSVHQAHAFSIELTEAQLAALRAEEHANTTHGVGDQSEQTAIRLRKVREILAEAFVDWGTLGMILSVLQANRSTSGT